MASSYIVPSFKRSLHVGCNEYGKVGMDNLHQTWHDAQKLNDLCEINDFDKTYVITDKKVSYKVLHSRVVETLNKLISQAEGAAESKAPQYCFNFISFSCHGVMSESQQTMAVIPYTEDGDNYCKQYINISQYAQKLAEIKNNFTVILFDGCRNEVTAQSLVISDKDKGTLVAKSKENCLTAQKAYYGLKYEGLTIVIFSSLKGAFAREEVDGGCGTKKFLQTINENIGEGLFSWEFIDSYENLYIEKVTMMKTKDTKKIIMFSKDKDSQKTQYKKEDEEEEKTSVKPQQSTQKPIDSKESLNRDMKVLETLNEQKYHLLQQLKTQGFDSQLIDQFLNTLMSSVKFSDPNDEVEAKTYVKSVLLILNSLNHLIMIEQVFSWIFIHMDKAKGLDESLAIAKNNSSQIVPKVLNSSSSKKFIYTEPSKIIKTKEFNDNGGAQDYNYTIIKANNGKVLQGGQDKNLYVLDSDLKELLKSILISGYLYSGMAIGNRLFCGQSDYKVTVFDEDTLALIQTINTQETVKTMLLIQEDYLLIGQYIGYIDIIQISTLSTIFQHQLDQQAIINDMIKTSNPNEYAIATDKGIVIAKIEKQNNKFTFTQTESYLNDKTVDQIAEVQSNILIACVYEIKDLIVINRKKKALKTILNASINGRYNCMQKVIGYDGETFPYLLLKDQHQISLINTKTFTPTNIIQSKYDAYPLPYSMVQYKENNEIRLLTLYHNYSTRERSIKEFVIGTV